LQRISQKKGSTQKLQTHQKAYRWSGRKKKEHRDDSHTTYAWGEANAIFRLNGKNGQSREEKKGGGKRVGKVRVIAD